uniref:Uncharacterized protein n=1 Tax=Amphilophus citrinellus TaxID=61819 RepID=A0A3Q0RNN1_AMPCI
MKCVVIFLVLTLVLFMAEPVEPRFRTGFSNFRRNFRGKLNHGPNWMQGVGSLISAAGAQLDDEMS